MKIGIKFCGGCNPKYDRKALLDKIREKFTDVNFQYFIPSDKYDLIWIISGCKSQCVDIDEITENTPKYLITTDYNEDISFRD